MEHRDPSRPRPDHCRQGLRAPPVQAQTKSIATESDAPVRDVFHLVTTLLKTSVKLIQSQRKMDAFFQHVDKEIRFMHDAFSDDLPKNVDQIRDRMRQLINYPTDEFHKIHLPDEFTGKCKILVGVVLDHFFCFGTREVRVCGQSPVTDDIFVFFTRHF